MDSRGLAPVGRGIAGYQEALAATWFPLQIELPGSDRDFEAAMASRDLGWVRITRAYSSASFRSRHRPSPRGAAGGYYVLHLTESGSIALTQNGRTIESGPGTLVLMDVAAPLDTEQRGAATALAVTLPGELLRSLIDDIDDRPIVAISAEHGLAALLRDMVLGLWREHEHLSEHDGINLPMALIRMVGSVFEDARDRGADGRWSAVRHHLARIVRAIERGLGDPDFSADAVAQELGLSKSYLYSITGQAGTSFGRLLMQRRLERARQMLADPALAARSVTDVAFAVGFRELSHFSRRFHGLFGASPREYRARMGRSLGLN